MNITMRDVATQAGVSLKTVSRVVNGEAHVRPEVKAKVEQAIAHLKWTPNPAAKALRSGRTGIIAVAVPSLIRPFNARLMEAIVSEITHRGLQADVTPSPSESRVRKIIASVGRSADAVVLIDLPVEGTVPSGLPVVSMMRRDPTIDSVLPDLRMATQVLSAHLAVLGRHRPLLVGCDRFQGYESVMDAALRDNLMDQSSPPIQMVSTRADGYVMASQIRNGPWPDAIIAGNDDLALGLLSGLIRVGVRVPEDVVVMGFDNLEDGLFSYPSLTSIDPDPGLLSRIALDRVTARTARSSGGPQLDEVPISLVRRESTLGVGTL